MPTFLREVAPKVELRRVQEASKTISSKFTQQLEVEMLQRFKR